MSRKNITENEIIDRIKRLYGVDGDRELAQLFKIAPHTVSGWRKRGKVPHEYIERVRQEKGVSFDYLYCGDEPTGVKEPISQYGASAVEEIATHDYAPQNTGGSDFGAAVDLLRQIYDSGDPPLINAIHHNLVQFARMARTKGRVPDPIEARFQDLEQTIEKKCKEMMDAFIQSLPRSPPKSAGGGGM